MADPRHWFMGQLALLSRLPWQFEYDDLACKWIKVYDFDLPKQIYINKTTHLLIALPFPDIENASGYSFYADQFLKRYDGATYQHIHPQNRYNDLAHKYYCRISFHLHSFRPSPDIISGDTVVDLMEAIYNFLSQPKGAI